MFNDPFGAEADSTAGRGGGPSIGPVEFIRRALNSTHGGHWQDGEATYFTSSEEAFDAGVAYLYQTNGWAFTYYGSHEATVVALAAYDLTGVLLSPQSVRTALARHGHNSNQDANEKLKDFLLRNFNDRIRELNKLALDNDWRLVWYVDYKQKYTRYPKQPGNTDMEKSTNRIVVSINFLALYKYSSMDLYLAVDHELAHVSDGALHYREWDKHYGEYFTEQIMEYRAYQHTVNTAHQFGLDPTPFQEQVNGYEVLLPLGYDK
jgi:hypothetical protein